MLLPITLSQHLLINIQFHLELCYGLLFCLLNLLWLTLSKPKYIFKMAFFQHEKSGNLYASIRGTYLIEMKESEEVFFCCCWYVEDTRIKRLKEAIRNHLVKWFSARVVYSPSEEYLRMYLTFFIVTCPNGRGPTGV